MELEARTRLHEWSTKRAAPDGEGAPAAKKLRRCACCGEEKLNDQFSKTQRKAKDQARCSVCAGRVRVKLPPGDAREPADPAGAATDGCFLPAAAPSTLQGGGSSVRGAPKVVHQQGRQDSCVLSSAASALD